MRITLHVSVVVFILVAVITTVLAQAGWVKQLTCIPHSSAGWTSEMRRPAWLGSGESSLSGFQMAPFSVSSHNREHALVSAPLLARTPMPSWSSTPLTSPKPNYFPKATPPNTITLGLQHTNWMGWGETVIMLPFLVFDPAGLYKFLGQGSANSLCKELDSKYLGSEAIQSPSQLFNSAQIAGKQP